MVNQEQVLEILHAVGEKITEEKLFLTELDNVIGDGDHGINLARGFAEVEKKRPMMEGKDIGTMLKTTGMALVSTVGGASGPLYGTAFMQAGKALAGKTELDAQDLVTILDAFVAGVQLRGKSVAGEKTMLDAMIPALDAVKAALDAGKHVFSEKPLGVTMEQCLQAEAAVARHPELVCMLGFMRRYDKSYAYAKEKITAGAIGTPYLVKSTGIDPEAVVEGAIRYSGTSGGIFLDSAIHDMDLMRWFLGSEAAEVYAMGCTFKHPAFQDAGDDETGVAVYKFKNGAMGMVHVGRTAPYGYHIETEIVGTEGTIRISAVPEKNRAMVYDVNGARTECVESFPERFAEAYLTEMEEFVRCVREGRKPDTGVEDGIYATRVGYATTEAWKTGKIVKI